jgi:membrane associated rhomboid family serine protease
MKNDYTYLTAIIGGACIGAGGGWFGAILGAAVGVLLVYISRRKEN